jgi:hypothetical protein
MDKASLELIYGQPTVFIISMTMIMLDLIRVADVWILDFGTSGV